MTWRRRLPTAIVAAVAISAATLGTFASRLGGSLGVHLPSWVEYLLFGIAGLAAGACVGPILHAIRERSRVFTNISDWLTLLDRTTTRLSGASWYFLLGYGIILIFGRENAGGWGYFILLVSGAFLAFAIGRVGSARGRRLAFEELRPFGWLVPFAYSLLVFFLAVAYVCHLADAIPLVDVTRTLKWSEPLTYNDHRIGGLVLGYQLLVILPLVAAFGSFWSFSRSQDDQTSPTTPRREPDRDASA